PGKIYNSNRYLLTGMLRDLGCEVVDLGIVPDSLAATKAALQEAAAAHLIISSGGVSVGDEDHVKAAVTALGELKLWKINLKPGKPLAFGFVGTTPFVGLPGNPVSAFVTLDRKSTRLNSRHVKISYAVFCLKKTIKRCHA